MLTTFLTETLTSNKGVTGLVTTIFGSTAATLFDWLPDIVSLVAAILAIILSVTVLKIKIKVEERNVERHTLEMALLNKQLELTTRKN